MQHKQEVLESAVSYSLAGGTITLAALSDVAEVAQALAIIFGIDRDWETPPRQSVTRLM